MPPADDNDKPHVIYTPEHPDGEHVSADAVRGALSRLIAAYLSTPRANKRLARLAECELAQLLEQPDSGTLYHGPADVLVATLEESLAVLDRRDSDELTDVDIDALADEVVERVKGRLIASELSYAATVDDAAAAAIFGDDEPEGAFRRFKDVLLSYPVERDRWFSYRSNLLHIYINGWLRTKDIVLGENPPWGMPDQPPEPDVPLEKPVGRRGEGPTETLRTKAKDLVEQLPALEGNDA